MNATVKRKPATSLANHDIQVLVAWYNAVRETYSKYLTKFPFDTWWIIPRYHDSITAETYCDNARLWTIWPKYYTGPVLHLQVPISLSYWHPSGLAYDFDRLSLHIPQLPLVFILSSPSPPSPSYLQTTYPRSTLALLRTHKYIVPSGIKVLEEVVLKVHPSSI